MITHTKQYRTRIFSLCLVWILAFFQSGFSNYYEINTNREAALLAGGAVVTALGIYLSNRVQPPDPLLLNSRKLPFWDRSAVHFENKLAAHLSYATLTIGIVMPWAISLSHPNQRKTDAVMNIESFLYTYGLTSICKGIFHRARPYAYQTGLESVALSKDASRSFFSGHTSMAFQGAVLAGMIYQTYHPDSRSVFPVWAAGLTFATVTGVFRVLSGNHFPTDVLAGAAVGALVGWGIPHLHEKTESRSNDPVSKSSQWVFQVQFNF